jgi:HD-GYP domain-containing protein (c-di-GMP phosphodiesterase class II)
MAIASRMGVPKEQIEVIARGALLHDVGKIAIPDNILLKNGKLTAEEFAVMKEHCYLGYKLVQKIPVLKEAAEIVYSHQEYYDGNGYPRQLKGENIPLGARIFSVADTLDAITSDRVYRKARSLTAARAEIQRCAGTQFDPEVVAVFQQMPDAVFEELRDAIGAQVGPLARSAGSMI